MGIITVNCIICGKPFETRSRGAKTAKVHKGECLAKLRSQNATKMNKRFRGSNRPLVKTHE